MPKKGPKGKKGKAAAAVDESVEVAPEPEPASEEPWTCLECEQENEFTDEACIACDEPRPKAAEPEAVDPYAGFKVGMIVSAEPVPKMDKLSAIEVDVGDEEPVKIITNAPNAKEGNRIVVALIGAIVRNGEEEIVIKKASVGGQASFGMVCDCPMLGWKGGAAGGAALLPESFEIGGPPPPERPRGDQ